MSEEVIDVVDAEPEAVNEGEESGEGKEYSLTGAYSSWVDYGSSYLKIEDPQNGELVDFTQLETIPEYAKFEMKISFGTPGDLEITSKDKIIYELPKWMRSLNYESGKVDGGGAEAGTWEVEDGKVIIQYNEGFLASSNKNLSGYFTLSGEIKTVPAEEGTYEQVIIHFGNEEKTLDIKKRTTGVANIDIKKELTQINRRNDNDSEITSAVYTIKVKAGSYTEGAKKNEIALKDIVITDAFTTGEKTNRNNTEYTEKESLKQYITYKDIKCVDSSGQEREIIVSGGTNGSCTIALNGQLEPDEELTITYEAVIDAEMYETAPCGENDADPGNGDSTNTVDMSWEMRNAENTASVTTATIEGSDGEPAKETAQAEELVFDKVWLWKGVNIHSNYEFSYELSVNESPKLDITGWVLTDDLEQYGQEIISDIRVTKDGSEFETISLADLQNGSVTGAANGSTTGKLVYKTEGDANYRFYFDAKMTEKYAIDDSKEKTNKALFSDLKGHEYGVNRTITPQAATITKRFVNADIAAGSLCWQTTIDKGVDIKKGDTYKDYVGWYTNNYTSQPKEEDQEQHNFNLEELELEIVAGKEETPVPSEAYEISLIPLDEVVKDKDAGFMITFKEDITGPVLIRYRSDADFAKVDKEITYTNDAYLIRDGREYFAYALYTYNCEGTIKKTAMDFSDENPTVTWQLEVNSAQYETKSLVVKDQIPDDLDFDWEKDIEIREAFKTNQNMTDAYTANEENKYYTVSYDEDTRELEIQFHDITSTKVVFWVKTTPTIEALKTGQDKVFNNTAKLWSAGDVPVEIGQSSARAQVTYEFVNKTNIYSATTAPDAVYTIAVNPGGMSLAEGNMLTLEDTMAANMLFKPDTLVITRTDNGEELNAGSDYILTPDADNRGFSLQIPDATPLKISYHVYVQGKTGTETQISNAVQLFVQGEQFVEKENDEEITIQKAQSGVSGPNRIIIEKADQKQYEKKLAGAKFEIFKYDGSIGESIGTVTTGENGSVTTPEDWTLKTGQIYALKEVEAPQGYLLDKTIRLFAFIDDETDISNFDPRVVMINVGQRLTFYVYDEPIEKIDIPVKKTWNDNNNQDGKRKAVTVKLYADNVDTGKTITLSSSEDSAKNWQGAFTDLPKTTSEGTEIVYTVGEDDVEGYTKSVSGTVEGFTITNTHTPETISVSGTKTWEDANNQDGKRPESITVQLYADGTPVEGKTAVLSGTTVNYSWDNLPKYANGTEIAYTVKEVGESNGKAAGKDGVEYTVTYDGMNITNTYLPKNGSISVTKYVTFNGDGIKLDKSFYVALFTDAEGTKRYSEVKELRISGDEDSDGTATVTFTDLPYGTYYVRETEADGNPFLGEDLGVRIVAAVTDGTVVLSAQNLSGAAVITNDYQDTPPGGFTYVDEQESESESESEFESEEESEEQSGTKNTTAKKNGKVAKTGDTTNYMLYVIAMLLAGGCAGGIAYGKKRKKQR